jgi:hypothetical protein
MMTPEERADELAKWVPADLRRPHWIQLRDSFAAALAEEREGCARTAEEAVSSYQGDWTDLKRLAAHVAAAIRSRSEPTSSEGPGG